MKKYDIPTMKITSFNDESVVTNNASTMAALQEWKNDSSNGLETKLYSVEFKQALDFVF